jgi:hypothetical protein
VQEATTTITIKAAGKTIIIEQKLKLKTSRQQAGQKR